MPSLRLLPDLEESIRQIPGVRAVSVVTDGRAQPTEVHVLDAERLEDGPVCRLAVPARVPAGYHSWWVPAEELASS